MKLLLTGYIFVLAERKSYDNFHDEKLQFLALECVCWNPLFDILPANMKCSRIN